MKAWTRLTATIIGPVVAFTLLLTMVAEPAGASINLCEEMHLGSWNNQGAHQVVTTSIDLPAGRHAVVVDLSDESPGRASQSPSTQDHEQIIIELYAGDELLATVGPSPDLEDQVRRAEWTGSLGTIDIDVAADRMRVAHAAPFLRTGAHSLIVECVRFAPPVDIPVVDPAVGAGLVAITGGAYIARRRRFMGWQVT